MIIPNLPFFIGPVLKRSNPESLPDTLDFEFSFDPEVCALRQTSTLMLEQVLRRAYEVGTSFGTPLADDSYGKPYADDFLSFLQDYTKPPGRTCEIGAGVGYLSRRLIDEGWEVTSLEPGRGYAQHWNRYGVQIIQDFFPTPRASGPFDLIIAYGVLEHVANPVQFLLDIRNHLSSEGVAVFSVPDCTEEIIAGDPSILLHEHFTYFNAETLAGILWRAGFEAEVRPSRHGRCLYAVARIKEVRTDPLPRNDLMLLADYPVRAERFIVTARTRLTELAEDGTVGLYCPGRALAVLDATISMRFFDDDPAQQGKFLPPFSQRIEGRDALLVSPVGTVVVMSRTFGERIRTALRKHGYDGQVLTVEELCK